ncbi:MAG: hypothetical protein HYT12_00370 [Candidatus Liptonbacteria bacterium]|nr:hypothetical protein [Candidatus Liptonbacteria bacterium]
MEYLDQFAQITLNFRENIVNFWGPYLPSVKFFSGLASLLLFTGIVYIVVRINYVGVQIKSYKDFFLGGAIDKKRTVKIWKQIQENLKKGDSAHRKLAVIEGDKVLDDILKLSGYAGDSLGDRLKQINPSQMSNIQDIWTAHKTRNRIVHEPGFDLGQSEAERVIGIYGRAFKELGLIDEE